MGDAPDIDDVVTSGNGLKYVACEVGNCTAKKRQALCLYPRNL
jgi:hypothetical protein